MEIKSVIEIKAKKENSKAMGNANSKPTFLNIDRLKKQAISMRKIGAGKKASLIKNTNETPL